MVGKPMFCWIGNYRQKSLYFRSNSSFFVGSLPSRRKKLRGYSFFTFSFNGNKILVDSICSVSSPDSPASDILICNCSYTTACLSSDWSWHLAGSLVLFCTSWSYDSVCPCFDCPFTVSCRSPSLFPSVAPPSFSVCFCSSTNICLSRSSFKYYSISSKTFSYLSGSISKSNYRIDLGKFKSFWSKPCWNFLLASSSYVSIIALDEFWFWAWSMTTSLCFTASFFALFCKLFLNSLGYFAFNFISINGERFGCGSVSPCGLLSLFCWMFIGCRSSGWVGTMYGESSGSAIICL